MDYKNTLNLPKTEFPMKADLPRREPDIAGFWEKTGVYQRIRQGRARDKKYILHDGPPYANGQIHIGHALNKTLKDIVVKYKTMQGFNSDYVPGWDCHGLPVEHQLFKELKINKAQIPQPVFRKKAHEYAMGFVSIQRDEFKRLGVFGDWQNPYLTLDKSYEAAIIRAFAALVKDGYIYHGHKPVNWCYECETALAEAEVEYEGHTSPSVYVKFRVLEFKSDELKKWASKEIFRFGPPGSRPRGDIYFVIWTTTPWTLIANLAIALHPDEDYVGLWAPNGDVLIVADKLKSKFVKLLGGTLGESKDDYIERFPKFNRKGTIFEGTTYEHPFCEQKMQKAIREAVAILKESTDENTFSMSESKVVLAEYVSMEEGTGCVHTAPGHGQEDYQTGLKYGLPAFAPVDEKGIFTQEAGEFRAMHVHKANPLIVEKLKAGGFLIHQDEISHSYPHCWRCKNTIIFRATQQWFMSIDHRALRKELLSEIKNVRWIPSQGEGRISSMVENRPDWCLSRQRYWGTPIPVFQCAACKKWVLDASVIEHVALVVERHGSDAWFSMDTRELLPSGFHCACGSTSMKKGEDIIDVWFESGVSHQAVLKKRDTLNYPADLYLEGSDQHRGWFQSALITSVAIDKRSAFGSVLTHGFVVDGEGRKMSKSLGNVISPQDIIKDYGADILRLWVASSDYNDDIRISDQILARLTEAYRKIRNTARFMLGNLSDFDPARNRIAYEQLLEIDKWAISKVHSLIERVGQCYEEFQFHKVYHEIYSFCVVDMSNFYLDLLKDRLYTSYADSLQRRSCQTALYEALGVLVTAIAPVLVYTAEEIWQHMPKDKDMPETVHLKRWPGKQELHIDEGLEEQWAQLIGLREAVLKVLEEKRSSGIIGSSLEANVTLYIEAEEGCSLIRAYENVLSEIFIVSQVGLVFAKASVDATKAPNLTGVSIAVTKASGAKCARCWNYSESVGNDTNYPQACHRCVRALAAIRGEG